MSVNDMHAWCPKRPEEGIRSPGSGVIDGCEQSWDKSQLTSKTEASFFLTIVTQRTEHIHIVPRKDMAHENILDQYHA